MERVVVAGVGIHPFGRFDADYRQIGAVAARGALDAEGFAALAREDGPFGAFLAGWIDAARELALFLAPNVNSYKRFVAGSWAPTTLAWGHDNRTCGFRVVGCSLQGGASEVLAVEADLDEQYTLTGLLIRADADRTFLHGAVVLLDEAGMAGTRHLDWLTGYARERGAVVRLLGDPGQLSAVEAGGALRLLAGDGGAVELTDLPPPGSDLHDAALAAGAIAWSRVVTRHA